MQDSIVHFRHCQESIPAERESYELMHTDSYSMAYKHATNPTSSQVSKQQMPTQQKFHRQHLITRVNQIKISSINTLWKLFAYIPQNFSNFVKNMKRVSTVSYHILTAVMVNKHGVIACQWNKRKSKIRILFYVQFINKYVLIHNLGPFNKEL